MTSVKQILDDERFKERVGGSFANKADSQLFTIEETAKVVPEKRGKEVKGGEANTAGWKTSGKKDPNNPAGRKTVEENKEEEVSDEAVDDIQNDEVLFLTAGKVETMPPIFLNVGKEMEEEEYLETKRKLGNAMSRLKI